MNNFEIFLRKAEAHIGLYKQKYNEADLQEAFKCLSIFIDNVPEGEDNKSLAKAYLLRGQIQSGNV